MRYEMLICVCVHITVFLIQECFTHNQHQETEDWMLICQRNADYHAVADCDGDHNWSASTSSYCDGVIITIIREARPRCGHGIN